MSEMPRELGKAPVSPSAKYTLSVLWTYSTPRDPVAWPSAATLAENTGQTVRTVRRQLAALSRAGLIRRTHRGHRRVWELLNPERKKEIVSVEAPTAGVSPVAVSDDRARVTDARGGVTDGLCSVSPVPPKLTSELTNELNARARGSGDGLGPAAPSPEKETRHAQERATDAQVVDLCSSVAAQVQDPALRALVESKGRGAVASLPELLARVRKPPARKVPEVACTRTSVRGTG